MRNETPPAEYWPHERVVEPAPVVVDGATRLGEEHSQAGRPSYGMAAGFGFPSSLLRAEERGEEGLRCCGLGDHAVP